MKLLDGNWSMQRVLALGVAVLVTLIVLSALLVSKANASTVCSGGGDPAPPSAQWHCSYWGADASSSYLHIGNADHVVANNALTLYNPVQYNFLLTYYPYWRGTTSYSRVSNTRVRVTVVRYRSDLRRACYWNGDISGADTGSVINSLSLTTCGYF